MNPSKLIGIDASRAFTVRPTGTERYATELIRSLAERAIHRYRLYTRSAPVPPFPAHLDWRILPAPRLWTHTRLSAELWRHPPDLLFVPAHVLPLSMPPSLPSVVTVHDLGYLAYPEAHTAFQRWYLEWTTRRHLRRATRLIADSMATRQDLITHYGAVPERVDVVHLAVEGDMRRATPAEVAEAAAGLGLGPEDNYLLFVGTLQPRKNLPRLIQAFARVLADCENAERLHLVVVGAQGWGGEDLAAMARTAGLDGRVRFAGYVARATLAALYSGALAFVMPSLYEGFGLPVLEAMACGTPVAASGTSSLPEVVGDAGLLFDPLDIADMSAALGRLVVDGALRERLARAGAARKVQFTWERTAAATEAVFARVLEGPFA